MKKIVIIIQTEVEDDLSIDALASVAANAKVQIEEPALPHPTDPFGELTFTTENVRCWLVDDIDRDFPDYERFMSRYVTLSEV